MDASESPDLPHFILIVSQLFRGENLRARAHRCTPVVGVHQSSNRFSLVPLHPLDKNGFINNALHPCFGGEKVWAQSGWEFTN